MALSSFFLTFLAATQGPVVGGGWLPRADFDAQGEVLALGAPGDVDGRGRADLAVAARGFQGQAPHVDLWATEDGVLLWRGSLPLPPAMLAPAGDFDGDGVLDLAAGMPDASLPGLPWVGQVRILSGADGAVLADLFGQHAGDRFGVTVAGVGDVDGDGAADLLVGADGLASFELPEGAVHLVSGAQGRFVWTVTGSMPHAAFGAALAVVPDTDRDGIAEFVVGAPGHDHDRGRVTLRSGADGRVLRSFEGTAWGDRFGAHLAGRPDVHAFLISAPGIGGGHVEAYVTDGLRLWSLTLPWQGTTLGVGLALAGDLDGDLGLDFLAVETDHGPAPQPARVSVWSGRPDGPRRLDDVPIATFGLPSAAVAFLGGPRHDGPGGEFAVPDGLGAVVHGWDPFLRSDRRALSAAAGGDWAYHLRFPRDEAGAHFALLLSLAGTGPVELFGALVPLTPDALFWDAFVGAYPPGFHGVRGALDDFGRARARVHAPPGAWTPLVGRTLWAAAVTFEGPASARSSSVAVPLEVLP